MNVSEALRTLFSQNGLTQSSVAAKMGVSQPAIASVLSVGNPQTRILVRMLDICDYELVAIPKGEVVPEGSLKLTARNQDTH